MMRICLADVVPMPHGPGRQVPAQPVLGPLTAAGLTAVIRPDGRLVVAPSERITTAIDAHIRSHRDELVKALSAAHPNVLHTATPSGDSQGLPPGWMEQDDARRAATMAAGKRHLAARRSPRPLVASAKVAVRSSVAAPRAGSRASNAVVMTARDDVRRDQGKDETSSNARSLVSQSTTRLCNVSSKGGRGDRADFLKSRTPVALPGRNSERVRFFA
jgi:hypothetical protein